MVICHGTEVSYESVTNASLDRIKVYLIGGPFKSHTVRLHLKQLYSHSECVPCLHFTFVGT